MKCANEAIFYDNLKIQNIIIMNQNNVIINNVKEGDLSMKPLAVSVDSNKISNVVLKRLIEEVQYESQNNVSAYNRSHNRHNRGSAS